jgi:Holliday junction resolvasome RuvABC ATP-dependent DNA helicase subunit
VAEEGLTESNDSVQITGQAIRAQGWEEIIGQTVMKEQLEAEMKAAVATYRNLDHFLLVGPPGYGKTTFAHAIAQEMRDPFFTMEHPGDEREFLWAIRNWPDGGIFWLDELQDASPTFQALVRTGLESGYVTPKGRTSIDVRHITFGAGTTHLDKIIEPLRDRFILQPHFVEYSPEEMHQIVLAMSQRCNVAMPDGVATGLARAAKGTPRLVGRLVVAARTLGTLGRPVTVEAVLRQVGVDENGLTGLHYDYLRELLALGGTAGEAAMRRMLSCSAKVVSELERDLFRARYIRPTPSGRTITAEGSARVTKPGRSPKERRAG